MAVRLSSYVYYYIHYDNEQHYVCLIAFSLNICLKPELSGQRISTFLLPLNAMPNHSSEK